jgi:hypothetical protein
MGDSESRFARCRKQLGSWLGSTIGALHEAPVVELVTDCVWPLALGATA